MVAGIITTAAADERLLSHPSSHTDPATAWLVLGGTALYLVGHAAFKAVVWRVVPWSRLAAVAGLGLLGLVATHVDALLLGAMTAVVLLAVIAADALQERRQAS
jgi:low temperature requirement protein LtrA